MVLNVTEIGSGNCIGRTGSASVTITVGGNISATITANPESGPPPLNVNFACNPTGGSGYYTNFEWNFGDGQTDSGSNKVSVSHTYSNVGSYTATCKVTDSYGNTVQASKTITVSSGLTLSATASPTSSSSAPVEVTFSCSVSGGQPPYSFLWQFGDGAESTEQNPKHTYNSNGIYSAKVTAVDGNGLSASKTITIKIGAISNPHL